MRASTGFALRSAGVAIVAACALWFVGHARAGESPMHFILAQRPTTSSPIGATRSHKAVAGGKVVRASWYGGAGERLNRYTASGTLFRASDRIAAHRSLAFGTRLEVVNIANGLSTIVTVSDRGPAGWTGRDLDLSRAAAGDIDMIRAGEARVSYRVLN